MKFELRDEVIQPEDKLTFWLEYDVDTNDIDLMVTPKRDPENAFLILTIHQNGTLTRWTVDPPINKHLQTNNSGQLKFSGEMESEE